MICICSRRRDFIYAFLVNCNNNNPEGGHNVKGSEAKMIEYMEGAGKSFVIGNDSRFVSRMSRDYQIKDLPPTVLYRT